MARTFNFGTDALSNPCLQTVATDKGIMNAQTSAGEVCVVEGNTVTAVENQSFQPEAVAEINFSNTPTMDL